MYPDIPSPSTSTSSHTSASPQTERVARPGSAESLHPTDNPGDTVDIGDEREVSVDLTGAWNGQEGGRLDMDAGAPKDRRSERTYEVRYTSMSVL